MARHTPSPSTTHQTLSAASASAINKAGCVLPPVTAGSLAAAPGQSVWASRAVFVHGLDVETELPPPDLSGIVATLPMS